MGAWGYEPFDNDTALDWIDRVCAKSFWDKVKSALEGKNLNEVRAAGHLTFCLLNGCRAVGPSEYDIRQIAIDALNRVLKDPKWLMSWDKPRDVIASIHSDIEGLQGVRVGTSLFGQISQGAST